MIESHLTKTGSIESVEQLDAALKPWSDPVCIEISVTSITRDNDNAGADGGIIDFAS